MPSTGRYVYGLVRAADVPELGEIGLEHAGAPGRVYALHAEGIAALVSEYDAKKKIAPLRRNLEPHDRVIREALAQTTIIPMTFGHVARSEREIERMLRRHADTIVGELDRLDDLVEMSVRVKWDVDNIFKYIIDMDPLIASLRDRIFAAVAPPTYDEKLELGRLFEERLETRRADVTTRLVASLAPHARDISIGRVRSETAIADLTFLVPRQGVDNFGQRVRDAAADWPSEYTFESSGPWAPFHFVQLRLDGAGEERAASC
jgi:hypothetical protein